MRENQSRNRNTTRRVLTVLNECVNSEHCDKITQRAKLSQNANLTKVNNCNERDRDLNSSRISSVYVRAKYEKDQTLQQIIRLQKIIAVRPTINTSTYRKIVFCKAKKFCKLCFSYLLVNY